MRRTFARLTRLLNRVTVALVLGQLAAVIAITVTEASRKKHRKLRRFPVTPPEPIAFESNELTIYTYGEHVFDDMIEAIDFAQERVYFETFIWKGDDEGQRFMDALIRAADRGVEVHVIWDEFANLVVPPKFYQQLPDRIRTLRLPAMPIPWSPRTWGRDHRKLLVVDGVIGFIGGYNIGSLYATDWRDTHARIVGPGAAEIENAFIDFWNLHTGRRRRRIEHNPKRTWQTRMWVHRNVPRLQVYPIRNMYLEAIDRASERIWFTHAYLIPDEDLIRALRDACRRGVDVRIIVPAVSNHVVADWLSRGFYTTLLEAGIKLYLFQGAMVHAKTATVDGSWSTIGTANIDRLSLWGNYEINLEIADPYVAERMEEIFLTDQSNTVQLNEERWARRSWVAKLTELFLSPLRPLF